jgi:hypothetical protein
MVWARDPSLLFLVERVRSFLGKAEAELCFHSIIKQSSAWPTDELFSQSRTLRKSAKP